MGQLPGEQGKLSDRISKLDEQLKAADSIIYTWANGDIAKSMNGVKDDLGKQQTGVTTQTEQQRIVDQLAAMIDNLVEHPNTSKFAQDQSGGGSGGGGAAGKKKLPSEAELNLVKALQKAVNTATKTLDAQKDKDKPALLAMGNRQGDLRNILGQLLDKSSQGKIHFGPEPDNRDQLPEEANKEDVENQELENQLLNDQQADEKTDKQVNLVGDRMARSRQRLALNNDPGKTTQIIQDRIIDDIDSLIDQARQAAGADAGNARSPAAASNSSNSAQAKQAASRQPGAEAARPQQPGTAKHGQPRPRWTSRCQQEHPRIHAGVGRRHPAATRRCHRRGRGDDHRAV